MESSLSENARAIILGSLLGDGSLAVSRGYVNARFQFRHSIKQKEYFSWKAEALKEICGKKCVWRQGSRAERDGWGTIKLRFGSKALPELTELSVLTRRGKKKTVRRKWLNQLTPLSLAIWWCDDGSLVSHTRHGVICTDGFTREEVQILRKYLRTVWHISTAITRTSRGHYRISIRSREELKKFLRIILPHIPVESMLYKATLLFKNIHSQQRWISEMTNLSLFSKSTIESIVRGRKKEFAQFRE